MMATIAPPTEDLLPLLSRDVIEAIAANAAPEWRRPRVDHCDCGTVTRFADVWEPDDAGGRGR